MKVFSSSICLKILYLKTLLTIESKETENKLPNGASKGVNKNGTSMTNGTPGVISATPVWLQEIKSNEIFNKRKKVTDNTEDDYDDIEEENVDDEYPDVKILHKTIDKNLLSKKEYVF